MKIVMPSMPAMMGSLFLGAALAIFMSPARCATSGWKPGPNVEIIVPAGPGGANDQLGRIIQKILQDQHLVDASISVVNKPGGGHTIALAYLNQHVGNGNYLQIETSDLLANYITGKSTYSYQDMTPLAILRSDYIAISVNVNSPLRTGRDFIDQLRKDPASVSIALSSALANPNHIAAALIAKAGGVNISKLNIVVFHSGTETLTELMGGHVQAVSGPAFLAERMLRGGKIRVLGVTAPKRMGGALADVPTWKEQGYDAIATNWRSVIGPKGMTREQIAFWDGVFAKLVDTREWKDALKKTLSQNTYMGSGEARKYYESQYREFKAVLTELGLAK